LTSDNHIQRSRLRRIFGYILPVGLTIIFLYIAFYNVNLSEVFSYVGRASIPWTILFILLFFFSHFIRAVRWKYLLASVSSSIKVRHLFGALMVGYGVNCVVPRLGEVSRAVLAGKWEGLSRSTLLGTVILERLIDIIFLGLSVIISVWLWSEDLYVKFPWLKSTLYITMIITAAAFIFLYLVIRYKEHFYGLLVRLTSRISDKAAHRLAYIFEMLVQGFGSLKGVKNYLIVILLSAFIISMYALNSYIGFFTLGMQNIQPVSLRMGWVLMSISSIGVAIPTPGGTGSYHTLAKSALVLLFGFSEVVGLAYAFLTHIVSYILFVLTAIIIYFVMSKRYENSAKIIDTKLDEL
jgi:glycosyltransferase 2 family protein